jgi:parallel beta-helix repeat protein
VIQVSAALQAAIRSSANQPLDLFELHLDSGVRYYSTEQIDWGGHTYLPYVESRSAVKRFENGEIDSVTVTFSNVDTVLAQILLNNEIEGRRLIVRKIDRTVFDDSLVIFNGLMDRPSRIDEKTAQISAKELLGSIDVEVPARVFSPTCPWPFKGFECGYAGAETDCNKSWARCSQLGNTNRYGGFRFIPHAGMYQYQEVESKRTWYTLGLWSRKKTKTITGAFNAVDDVAFDVPIPIVLGRAQISGIPIQHVDEGGATKILAALAVGTCSEFTYPRANGHLVADWDAHFGQLGGVGSQTPDPRFPGSYPYNLVCYIGITVPSDVAQVDSAPSVDCVLLGAIVDKYNADGTYAGFAWTDNPIWNIRHLLSLPLHQGGMGFPQEWIDNAHLAAEAPYCDELILDTTGSQQIFEPSSLPASVEPGDTYRRYQSTGVQGVGEVEDGPYIPYEPGISDTSTVPPVLQVKRFTMNVALGKSEKALDVLQKKLFPSFRGYRKYSKEGKLQVCVEKPEKNTTIATPIAAGANQVDCAAAPFSGGDLVLVGSLTASAEVLTLSGVAGNTLQFTTPALRPHAAGETIHRIAMAFNDSTIVGSLQYPLSDRQPSTNRVTLKYVDAPAGFEARELRINDYEHQDKVHRINNQDVDGSAIDNYSQAWRVGQWLRAKARDLGKFISFTADMQASLLEIGDVIAVSAGEVGLQCVPFRLIEITYEENDEVSLVGQIYALGVYSDSAPQTTVTIPSVFAPIVNTPTGEVETSPMDFGGVGDGVADDTTAVQAAINAGTACKIPAGKTFLVTDVNISNRTGFKLHGNGKLKQKASSNTTLLAIVNAPRTVVDSVEVDGNQAGQTAPATAIHIVNSAYTSVSGAYVHDASGDGIVLENNNASTMADECKILDCFIQGNAGHGLHLLGTGTNPVAPGDNLVQGNHIDANGGHGIWAEGGNHNVFAENQALSNTLHGVKIENATGLEFSGNKVRNNNANGGLFSHCSHGRISGNEFHLNSRGAGAYSGLDVDTCSDMQVEANYAGDQGGEVRQDYGLQVYGPSFNIRIADNTLPPTENEFGGALISASSTYTSYNNKGLSDSRVPITAPPAPSNVTMDVTGGADTYGADGTWANPNPAGTALSTERRLFVYLDAALTQLEASVLLGTHPTLDLTSSSDGMWDRQTNASRWILMGVRCLNYEGTPSAWAYSAAVELIPGTGSGAGEQLDITFANGTFVKDWSHFQKTGLVTLRQAYVPPYIPPYTAQNRNVGDFQGAIAFLERSNATAGESPESSDQVYTGNPGADPPDNLGHLQMDVVPTVGETFWLHGHAYSSTKRLAYKPHDLENSANQVAVTFTQAEIDANQGTSGNPDAAAVAPLSASVALDLSGPDRYQVTAGWTLPAVLGGNSGYEIELQFFLDSAATQSDNGSWDFPRQISGRNTASGSWDPQPRVDYAVYPRIRVRGVNERTADPAKRFSAWVSSPTPLAFIPAASLYTPPPASPTAYLAIGGDLRVYTLQPSWVLPAPLGTVSGWETEVRFYQDGAGAVADSDWINLGICFEPARNVQDFGPFDRRDRSYWGQTRVRSVNATGGTSAWTYSALAVITAVATPPQAQGIALTIQTAEITGVPSYRAHVVITPAADDGTTVGYAVQIRAFSDAAGTVPETEWMEFTYADPATFIVDSDYWPRADVQKYAQARVAADNENGTRGAWRTSTIVAIPAASGIDLAKAKTATLLGLEVVGGKLQPKLGTDFVLDANGKVTQAVVNLLKASGYDASLFEVAGGIFTQKAIATNLLVAAMAVITSSLRVGGGSAYVLVYPTGRIEVVGSTGSMVIEGGNINMNGNLRALTGANIRGLLSHENGSGAVNFSVTDAGASFQVPVVLSTPLPLASGGTGANTAAGARSNLQVPSVGELTSGLDGKSNVGHGHGLIDIYGLDAQLGAKSNVGHGHSSDFWFTAHGHWKSQITDFAHTHPWSDLSSGPGSITLNYKDHNGDNRSATVLVPPGYA